MPYVASQDGTQIAFETAGNGPAVVLVDGALCYRELWGGRALAAALSDTFSAYTYDRRGRGESGDTLPYSVQREVEDIEALVAHAGGQAFLYGLSSGAVLALRAAAKLGSTTIPSLVLNAAPFGPGDKEDRKAFARNREKLSSLLDRGQWGGAVVFFLADMMPPEALAELRHSPDWPRLEGVAPTLAYDYAVMGDGALPLAEAREATMPVLIVEGSESPPFVHVAAEMLARTMPQAQRMTLRDHGSAQALAALLVEFLCS